MITMEHVCKSYKIAKRNAGLQEAFRSFFHREYEVIHALDDVSFTIRDGEMVGYIGPNGAGKSSTIKILSGILTPDSGTVLVDGRIPYENRMKHVKEIGVVFGQRSQLWWDVPVIDSFELLKDIYSIPNPQYQQSLNELTELLNLEELLRSPARQLSLGQRMRCEIAASLLHRPKILFLDEPTIGLDAVSKITVREFILKQNQMFGTTVILTTHDMQDIEALASRIILIGKGKILLDGTLEDIKKAAEGRTALERKGFAAGRNMTGERTAAEGGNVSEARTDLKNKAAEKKYRLADGKTVRGQDAEHIGKTIDETIAELYRSYDI